MVDGGLEVPVQFRQPLVAAAQLRELFVVLVDEENALARKRTGADLIARLDPLTRGRREHELQVLRAQLDRLAAQNRERGELAGGDLL